MLKLLYLSAITLSLSGCCQVLGICTSASIHTSISSPQRFAEQSGKLTGSQAPVVAGVDRCQTNGGTRIN
jgi:hypothetical protein